MANYPQFQGSILHEHVFYKKVDLYRIVLILNMANPYHDKIVHPQTISPIFTSTVSTLRLINKIDNVVIAIQIAIL